MEPCCICCTGEPKGLHQLCACTIQYSKPWMAQPGGNSIVTAAKRNIRVTGARRASVDADQIAALLVSAAGRDDQAAPGRRRPSVGAVRTVFGIDPDVAT